MSPGERLKWLRESRDIDKTKLAEEFGVSDDRISSYEKDRTSPSLLFAMNYVAKFGVSLDWIATGNTYVDEIFLRELASNVLKNDAVPIESKGYEISKSYKEELNSRFGGKPNSSFKIQRGRTA